MSAKQKKKWTRFMDMHSGGRTKVAPYEKIYIEAGEAEAKVIFYNRFGRNPDRVTCTCCGSDYSIDESETLADATGYDRGCAFAYKNTKGKEVPESEAWVSGKGIKKGYTSGYVERACTKYSFAKKYMTLAEYKKQPDVLIIHASEIKVEERKGHIPDEGYVWVGA
jgi:hypothetical protein